MELGPNNFTTAPEAAYNPGARCADTEDCSATLYGAPPEDGPAWLECLPQTSTRAPIWINHTGKGYRTNGYLGRQISSSAV